MDSSITAQHRRAHGTFVASPTLESIAESRIGILSSPAQLYSLVFAKDYLLCTLHTTYVYHIHILHFALCWVCRYLYRPLDLLLHGLLRIVRTKVVQRDLVRVFMRAGDADEVCFLTLFRARSVVQCSKEFDNTAERRGLAHKQRVNKACSSGTTERVGA